MRIANLSGRLTLLKSGRAVNVHQASGGRFSSDPQAVYERWDAFRAWADAGTPPGAPYDPAALGAPAPAPRQLFAVGLNYREHVTEAGFAQPDGMPPVFTKFAASITGPVTDVVLPEGATRTGKWNWSSSSAGGRAGSRWPGPGTTWPV